MTRCPRPLLVIQFAPYMWGSKPMTNITSKDKDEVVLPLRGKSRQAQHFGSREEQKVIRQ